MPVHGYPADLGVSTQSPVILSQAAVVQGLELVQFVGCGGKHVPVAVSHCDGLHRSPVLQIDPKRLQSLAHGPPKSPWARCAGSADILIVIVW